MTEITRLDDATISKIAAGEVVERPASVVKELVENSLDAGATRIDVTVAAGGTDLIRVEDDGQGMTEDDVKRAVEQHTTSKIGSIEDLETGVATLGFRGEALHTIGAVSRMTIETRPQNGPDVGTEVRVEGGDVTDVAPVGRAPGTTVRAADLFYNTPARRKYLKRDATEFAHVNRVVSRYALANPAVAISLTHGDNEVFATAGTGDLQGAVLSVYGRDVAESMIGVSADPAGPVASVSGLVSDPETTRSGAEYVSTYVNGRYVRAESLRSAILEAYGKQLAGDRYPFAVLFLEVPPETVDVNVHPRKMAVRFDDEEAVTEAVTEAVRSALLDHGLLRSGAPRGRSAPGETAVRPEAQTADSADEDATAEPEQAGTGASVDNEAGSDSVPPESSSDHPGSPERGDTTSAESGSRMRDIDRGRSTASTTSESPESAEPPSRHSILDRPGIDLDPLQTDLSADSGDEAAIADVETDRLPPLRILGQLDDTYVVAESPDGLVLIDQHAADERVNYERLQAKLGEGTGTQRLVDPVELSVTPQEASQFEAVDEFETWGFEASVEDGWLVVTGVPAVFDATLSPELLRDVLGSALDSGGSDDLESAADALLGDMACYPSITGNTSLTEGSIVDLVRALDSCENPYACPHGRPTIIELSIGELEDRFERDYPGHEHRRP
ncbi:MAG: DNA mismatch repair endonuclease MutL [Halodesulfurarchaeum sp.]|nr:DNA mismatch repair endonuclease MutL [Halodesulfurarchaeum sp.]